MSTSVCEYLVSYGRSGDFGRFCPAELLECRRGDRVVVRSPQGLEVGVVLCPLTAGHDRFLARTVRGDLLRLLNVDDERACDERRRRSQLIFDDARRLAMELELPLEIIDVDVILGGDHAVIYHLRQLDCDYRPLVSTLSRLHDIHILMENLTVPKLEESETGGCGLPGCGKADGGSCSSCGSGGGCSTCGKGAKPNDVAAFLHGLRAQIDASRQSLL